MKRKSPQVKISKRKLILIGSVLVTAGFLILFFSIGLSAKHGRDRDGASEPAAVQKAEDTGTKAESPRREFGEAQIVPSVPLAMAPRPENTPVPPPAPVPESPQKTDEKPEKPAVQPSVTPVPPSVTPVPSAAKKSGKLIFIFDDAGNSLKQAKPFLQLPFPLTIAVLPGLPESKATADAVRAAGKEVFLHQPMQAIDLSIYPGPGSIQPDMTTGEAARIVRKNIAEIGPIAGMNNHEGSLITADRNLIGAVLDVCIDEKIIFLDSRTGPNTQAPLAAMERGMHIWERDVFLDNKPVKAEMRAMIEKGLAIADKKGYAIMIGHVQTPPLAELLNYMYADLKNQGYVFTTLSRMKK